jgi:hypothetical protein
MEMKGGKRSGGVGEGGVTRGCEEKGRKDRNVGSAGQCRLFCISSALIVV